MTASEAPPADKGPFYPMADNQAMPTPDGFCKMECPYMETWNHPFFHNTAWCWKQMRDLGYYDGLIADCLHRAPDERLALLLEDAIPCAGVTDISPKDMDDK